MRRTPTPHLIFAAICLAVLVAGIVRNAWLCDDAFITFRSVDNLLNGYGIVWNVGERVQAFTHPLWFLLLSLGTMLTGNVVPVAFVLGISCTAVATLFLFRAVSFTPSAVLVMTGVLCLSVAFTSFATSGLENPLAHILLAACFLSLVAVTSESSPGVMLVPALALGLLYLTRPDAILLVMPVFVYASLRIWSGRRDPRTGVELLGWIALGLTPALIWTLFALFYFGFPLPNTALAKLNHGVPTVELLPIGWAYVTDPFHRDPVTAAAVLGALGAALWIRQPALLLAGLGILAHLGYLVAIGGDFMAGRYLTLSLFMALLMLTLVKWPKVGRASLLLLPLVFLSPIAWYGAVEYTPEQLGRVGPSGIIDERDAYFHATRIGEWWNNPSYPNHKLAETGREWKAVAAAQDSLLVRTSGGIGMMGFLAGPAVHIVDPLGLADPLLSRLPALPEWRTGHFLRAVPCGYVDAIRGSGSLCDPRLAEFHAALTEVVSGDLWSWHRFRLISQLNTGRLGVREEEPN